MHERLVVLLMELLKEIDTSGDINSRLKDLSEKLRLQGFSEKELNAALSWLADRFQIQKTDSDETLPSRGSVRVLHPVERTILTPEAYGYLLHLADSGFIDRDQMEVVIEKAVSSGMNRITVDDIKVITATAVFNSESPDWISHNALWSDNNSNLKIQ